MANKALTIPLMIVGTLALLGMIMVAASPTNTFSFSNDTSVSHSGSIPTTTWTLGAMSLVLGSIGVLIGIVLVAGVHVLGIGVSDLTQLLVLKSAAYFGIYLALWAAAGVITSGLGTWETFLQASLTIMFTLGFVIDIRSNAA